MENEVLTEEKKEKKKISPTVIINIVVNTIFYIFIFLLLLFSISQIRGSKEGKVKNLFGLGYEVVASNSMEPYFEAGDLLWVHTNFKQKQIKIGTIVTFYDTVSTNPNKDSKGFLNTHRVVDIVYNSEGKVAFYVLQGDIYKGTSEDYNILTDEQKPIVQYQYQYTNGPIQIVGIEKIRAVYSTHWDNAGNFINWLSNPKKGFVIIIICTAAFVLFEMFMVIKNIMEIKTQNMQKENEISKEEMKKSLEEERERMKKELLEELKKEQEQNKDKE